jgi:hypothetical protein
MTMIMMTMLLVALVIFPAVASGQSASSGSPPARKAEPLVIKLGTKSVSIPAPQGYEEATSQFPSLMELFTKTEDAGNDMLAVYVPAEVAATMRANGGNYQGLSVFHAKIAVDKELRNKDCSPADFAQFVSMIQSQQKALRADNPIIRGRVKELEKALGKLDTGVTKYDVAETELLGVIENTPNVYSMLMFVRLRVEADGEKRNLPRLCALTALRVNQRLLYVYTYRVFNSSADADTLEKFTRDWIAQIIAANPGD